LSAQFHTAVLPRCRKRLLCSIEPITAGEQFGVASPVLPLVARAQRITLS